MAQEAGTLSNENQSYGYNSLRPLKVIYFFIVTRRVGGFMNHSSNNHPPTQPPRNGHKVSQRGLLSIAMLILSMGAFGIAALSGAKMIYNVLGNHSNSAVVVVIAQIIVIGLA